MIDGAKDTMQSWAAARGLRFEREGLLPPVTESLRAGLGAGEHRSGFVTKDEGGVFSARGGFTKRPERSTWNLCSGRLPGGVDGVVAHHVHLATRSDSDGGESWYAFPRTVVFAMLPDGARAVRWLTGKPGGLGTVTALATVSLGRKTTEPVAPVPSWRQEIDGIGWTATPAEDPARLELIARPATAALAAAPASTRVELYDGALAVVARGVIDDPQQLDALCAVAAAVASAVATIVASEPALDPAVAVGAPARDARQEWLDTGVRHVTWSSPPASVDAAQAAYREVADRGAKRRGVRWKVRLIALVAILIGIALWSGIDAAFILAFPDYEGELLVLLAITLFIFVPLGIRAAWQAGGEVHADEVSSRGLPWGLEAFVREYAAAHGLTVEDPVRFRHRFRSPIAGIPMRVMHGDLGGTRGWLALWADDTMPQRRHLLVAVVPAPEGAETVVAGGYGAHVRDGLLVLAEEVPASERSAARLDALRAAAAHAAGVAATA